MDNYEIKELADGLIAASKDGDYIFRGTPQIYSANEDGINSTLYRNCVNPKQKWVGCLRPADTEKEILERLQNKLKEYKQCTNIEILTDLRHYGGMVTLIDFSFDIYTALFFACNGDFAEDGELIMLERSKIPHIEDIDYERIALSVVNPVPTKDGHKRSMSQKSVFVYAPDGFISKGENILKTIPIKRREKKGILTYLKDHHKISQNSIYKDLLGFIDNEKKYAVSRDKYDEGLLYYKKEDFDRAIQAYDDAIDQDLDFVDAYLNRAFAKIREGDYKGAAEDLEETSRLNQNYNQIITHFVEVAEEEMQEALLEERIEDDIREKRKKEAAEEQRIEYYAEKHRREKASE